jgi:cobalamin-dependent methionine synthase I
MAVTIGHEADRGIALAQKRGMLEGMMMDACASVRADALCDEAEAGIRAELKDGEWLTSRFSPGYGDAPLVLTEDIISLLDATRRIGLSMTRSLMMTPVKSVTAIVGVTAKEAGEPGSSPCREALNSPRCGVCSMSGECPYRL